MIRVMMSEVQRRLNDYDQVSAKARLIDENIICLGALGFLRPDVIPWVGYALYGFTDIVPTIPGFVERAEHGKRSLERVVEVTGQATPFQALLLT